MKTNIRRQLLRWCPQPKASAPTNITKISQHSKRTKFLYVIPITLLVALILGFLFFMSTYIDSGPVDIEVTTDKQSYLPGEQVQFHIYLKNPQIWRTRYSSTITYEIEQNGTLLWPFSTHSKSGEYLVPALSRTLYDTYVWDQRIGLNRTQVPNGNYTFHAYFGGIHLTPVLDGNHTQYDVLDGSVTYGSDGKCTIEIKPTS